jgi:hypothetical protein
MNYYGQKSNSRYHSLAVDIVKNYQIIVPVTVLSEVDYLVTKYLGERVARTFLEDIKEGYFEYVNLELNQIDKITQLMERYQDLPLGFVDASLVILAEFYQIKRILSLDRRHFNLIQTESVKYLEILP